MPAGTPRDAGTGDEARLLEVPKELSGELDVDTHPVGEGTGRDSHSLLGARDQIDTDFGEPDQAALDGVEAVLLDRFGLVHDHGFLLSKGDQAKYHKSPKKSMFTRCGKIELHERVRITAKRSKELKD